MICGHPQSQTIECSVINHYVKINDVNSKNNIRMVKFGAYSMNFSHTYVVDMNIYLVSDYQKVFIIDA